MKASDSRSSLGFKSDDESDHRPHRLENLLTNSIIGIQTRPGQGSNHIDAFL